MCSTQNKRALNVTQYNTRVGRYIPFITMNLYALERAKNAEKNTPRALYHRFPKERILNFTHDYKFAVDANLTTL